MTFDTWSGRYTDTEFSSASAVTLLYTSLGNMKEKMRSESIQRARTSFYAN